MTLGARLLARRMTAREQRRFPKARKTLSFALAKRVERREILPFGCSIQFDYN